MDSRLSESSPRWGPIGAGHLGAGRPGESPVQPSGPGDGMHDRDYDGMSSPIATIGWSPVASPTRGPPWCGGIV